MPATRPTQADEVHAELQAVTDQLGRRRAWLHFEPALEQRFEADMGPGRRRDLLLAGLLSLVVYDLFLFSDAMSRPEAMADAWRWRGALTAYGLCALALVWRNAVGPLARELLMGSTVVLATLCSVMIVLATQSAARVYDPFVFCLILMAGNIAYGLRFTVALASSVLCLAVSSIVVLQPAMPAEARPFLLGQLVGTAVFSLLACHRMERSARQSYLLGLRDRLRTQAAQQSAQAFARLSNTDALTGLPNRRAFDAALQAHTAEAAPDDTLALLVIDVDHFKRYNDHHGHPAGDACLRRVAEAMRGRLRAGDLLARLGGEEFALMLPGAMAGRATDTAERLRLAVQAEALPQAEPGVVVTVSIGVALGPAPTPEAAQALLAHADQALYAAKHGGRNRHCLFPGAPAAATDRAHPGVPA